jgi:hypothetical protein
MSTTKNTQPSETEALRADLDKTRQHLADTVQELSRQLNVPRRIKESAAQAGHRAAEAAGTAGHKAAAAAGTAGHRAAEVAGTAGQRAAEVAGTAGQRATEAAGTAGQRAKQVPSLTRQHSTATAAISGLVAGAAAVWIAGRGK